MYRVIWFLQIFGLVQFIRTFSSENGFVSVMGMEQNAALFLSIIIFFFFGFIRARKYDNYALIYNILAHGSKENPIGYCSPKSKNFLKKINNHFYCEEEGRLYPVINGIPCLESDSNFLCARYPEVSKFKGIKINK